MSKQVREAAQAVALAGNLNSWRVDGMVLSCLLLAATTISAHLIERIR
jgi:hypothetical protein